MKIKSTLMFACIVNLLGCQSTTYPDYAYYENVLNEKDIQFLESTQFSQRDGSGKTEVQYVRDGSYLEYTRTIDPGFAISTKDQDRWLYSVLCEKSDDKFTNFIQDKYVGILLVIKSTRSSYEVGPWNSSICKQESVF